MGKQSHAKSVNTVYGRRYGEIDVLRGLAALCVVLSHYSTRCVNAFQEAPFGMNVDLVYGFYAVQLFFIISGFVISLTLEKCKNWRDFAFSRASRLYPAYWASLTLVVALEGVIFGKDLWVGGYITNMTMFQEYFGFPNLDNVFWSLTIELAFYAVMGLVFATGLLSRIELVAAIWLVLACLWSLVHQYIGIGLPGFLPRFFVLQHLPFFVAGIGFYRVSLRGLTSSRCALILGALIAAGWIDSLQADGAAAIGWIDGLRRLGVAAILFSTFGLAVSGKVRFAVSSVTLWLGAISYPLYLSHHNLGGSMMVRLHELGFPVGLLFTLTLATALLLAYALARLVEQPALRALRQWYRAKSHAYTGES